jgi:hypothetical protein
VSSTGRARPARRAPGTLGSGDRRAAGAFAFDGDRWSAIAGAKARLTRSGFDDERRVATGTLIYDGECWRAITKASPGDWRALGGPSDALYAVGSAGLVMRRTAASARLPRITSRDLARRRPA